MLHPTTLNSSLQRALWRILPVIALMFSGMAVAHAATASTQTVKNVVLVHGGFVDGSGWQSVYKILTNKGYNVTVVQNPTITLEGDVAVTKRAIDAMNGPVILVGHSYGGAVISQAGTDPTLSDLFISPHLHWTTANLSVLWSRTLRRARHPLRFCRPRLASCF